MDKLEQYRQILQTILSEYVKTPIANGRLSRKPFLMFSVITIAILSGL